VLLGAQVAYAHQHLDFLEGERQLLAQSPAGREKLALHTMLLVGRNFYHGIDPMSVSDLAADLRIPAGLVKEFLDIFAESRLVLPIVDGETYVLGRDPETIGIKDILDCVRNSGKKIKIPDDPSEEASEINALLRDVDDAMTKSLAGKSLQAVILSLPPPAVGE